MPRDPRFSAFLGMTEMEIAAEFMWDKAKRLGVGFHQLRMRPTEFIEATDNSGQMTLVGFCQLLARGFMIPSYPNSEFAPDKEFVRRINARMGTNYPDPETELERAQKMIEGWNKAGLFKKEE